MRAWLKARPSLNTGNTKPMRASRSTYGASSATLRSLGQITPVGAARSRSSGSARSRACGTMTATPSGTGASSSQRTNRSSTTLPCLTSRIDALPERLNAEPRDGIDEQLVRPIAQLEISGGDVLHHVGDVAIGHGRADQRAELRLLVGAAADRHLVELLAVLLDAENADVADVVMTAGVDAAGDVDVQAAEIARHVEIAEAAGELLRHRNRAGIGEAAIVEARTRNDVGREVD